MLGVEESPSSHIHAEAAVIDLITKWNTLNDICDKLHAEPPTGWLVVSTKADKLYNFFPNYPEAQSFADEYSADVMPQYSTPLTRVKP
jgi:hypothetical protein